MAVRKLWVLSMISAMLFVVVSIRPVMAQQQERIEEHPVIETDRGGLELLQQQWVGRVIELQSKVNQFLAQTRQRGVARIKTLRIPLVNIGIFTYLALEDVNNNGLLDPGEDNGEDRIWVRGQLFHLNQRFPNAFVARDGVLNVVSMGDLGRATGGRITGLTPDGRIKFVPGAIPTSSFRAAGFPLGGTIEPRGVFTVFRPEALAVLADTSVPGPDGTRIPILDKIAFALSNSEDRNRNGQPDFGEDVNGSGTFDRALMDLDGDGVLAEDDPNGRMFPNKGIPMTLVQIRGVVRRSRDDIVSPVLRGEEQPPRGQADPTRFSRNLVRTGGEPAEQPVIVTDFENGGIQTLTTDGVLDQPFVNPHTLPFFTIGDWFRPRGTVTLYTVEFKDGGKDCFGIWDVDGLFPKNLYTIWEEIQDERGLNISSGAPGKPMGGVPNTFLSDEGEPLNTGRLFVMERFGYDVLEPFVTESVIPINPNLDLIADQVDTNGDGKFTTFPDAFPETNNIGQSRLGALPLVHHQDHDVNGAEPTNIGAGEDASGQMIANMPDRPLAEVVRVVVTEQ